MTQAIQYHARIVLSILLLLVATADTAVALAQSSNTGAVLAATLCVIASLTVRPRRKA